MGSQSILFWATINRLGARLGHGLSDAAAEIAVFAQDAPIRIREEWELFLAEVKAEAERLENGDKSNSTYPPEADNTYPPEADNTYPPEADNTYPPEADKIYSDDPQKVIDRIRAKVAHLNSNLEGRS